MSLKPFVLTAALLVSVSATAQQYEKNGQPCVAELCVGDGIAEIAKVKWDTAVGSFSIGNQYPPVAGSKVSDSDLKRLKTVYPEVSGASAPYLQDKKFDNAALPALAKLGVQCSQDYLEGNYTTANGNPTHVRISLIPDAKDSSKQTWFVTLISRQFPASVTNEQRAEVRSQLQERYKRWLEKRSNPKPGESRVEIDRYNDVKLNLVNFQGLEEANRRKQHPQCGGTAKVGID